MATEQLALLEEVVAERKEALTWPEKATALKVADNAACVRASEMLLGIKALQKQIEDKFDPHIERAYAAHRGLCADKKQTLAPLVDAERILKANLVLYNNAQEVIRLAKEAELQAQARKDEEERRLNEAIARSEEAKADGDLAAAEAFEAEAFETPIEAPVVVVPKLTPKVAGIAYKDNFKAHPNVDIKKLAAEVAVGRQPTNYILPNMPALNALAKHTKGTQKVPGVTFFNERGVAAGR
jgi:hypothetical protein